MTVFTFNEASLGRTVTIIYESKSSVITKRTIHILMISDCYIVAFCYMRGKIRKFTKEAILAWETNKQ